MPLQPPHIWILLFVLIVSVACERRVVTYTNTKTGHHFQDYTGRFDTPDQRVVIVSERVDHKFNYLYLYNNSGEAPILHADLPHHPSSNIAFSSDGRNLLVFNDGTPLLYSVSTAGSMVPRRTVAVDGISFVDRDSPMALSTPEGHFITAESDAAMGKGLALNVRSKEDLKVLLTLKTDRSFTDGNIYACGGPELFQVEYNDTPHVFRWDATTRTYTEHAGLNDYRVIGGGLAARTNATHIELSRLIPSGKWETAPAVPCVSLYRFIEACSAVADGPDKIGVGRYATVNNDTDAYYNDQFTLVDGVWVKTKDSFMVGNVTDTRPELYRYLGYGTNVGMDFTTDVQWYQLISDVQTPHDAAGRWAVAGVVVVAVVALIL